MKFSKHFAEYINLTILLISIEHNLIKISLKFEDEVLEQLDLVWDQLNPNEIKYLELINFEKLTLSKKRQE